MNASTLKRWEVTGMRKFSKLEIRYDYEKWNVAETARAMHVPRSTVYRYMGYLNIKQPILSTKQVRQIVRMYIQNNTKEK